MRLLCFVVLTTLVLAPIGSRAKDHAQPVPADGKCLVAADEQWTPQERFVWRRVCAGETADFNNAPDYPDYGGNLDPRKPGVRLPDSRILRSSFIETILLKDTYRRALTHRGVQIEGARLTERLTLENATLGHVLGCYGCLFEKGADLSHLRSADSIAFSESRVEDKLEMNGLEVGGSLFMRNGAELVAVNLTGAHVGGTFDLDGSKVTGKLDMVGLQVGRNLFMRDRATFAEVDLRNARVGGNVEADRSKVTGTLIMEGLHVAGSLFMRGANIDGDIDCVNLEVARDAFLGNGNFAGHIDFTLAQIKGKLELTAANFPKGIDLTGTQISGALELGSPQVAAKPSPGGALVLRNARADRIPSLADAWPPKLELDGFTCRSVGKVDKFEDWFKKIERYAPQPYSQLALVVQNQGDNDTATAIRYAGKNRERSEASFWPAVWLTALWGSIGYGYHIERALIWVAVLVVAGTLCLRFSDQGWRNGLRSGLDEAAFSFDLLLPVIKLREKHYQIDLEGWPRYYFYFHKIMGFVLASFLIAGLSGLTK